jgi:YD repeat-containing protein
VAVGDETKATPPIDMDSPASVAVSSGFGAADLIEGRLSVGLRASRGSGGGSQAAALRVVSVTANFTLPGSASAPVYDDNGNMLSDGSYGNRGYGYDTLGRLIAVESDGLAASYELDGFGNRCAETINGVTTEPRWISWRLG